MEINGGVYVLRIVDTNSYKIGMSGQVEKRIAYWHRSFPVLDLEEIAIFYTEYARKLEVALHKQFEAQRLEGSEWFELSSADEEFFEQETEDLISLFAISGNGHREGPYSNISGLPKPEEINHEDEESQQPESIELVPEAPQRLRRVEEGEPIDPEKIPSLEDEFHLGLVPEVQDLYEEFGSWQAVADHYGVPKEIVWAIGVHEDGPISFMNDIRTKLGLSTLGATHDPMPIDLE